MPKDSLSRTTSTAIVNETRAAYSTRVYRSRPRWSTPSRCTRPSFATVPGGAGRAEVETSMASRGNVVISGASKEATKIISNRMDEITASLWRRKRRKTTLSWLSWLASSARLTGPMLVPGDGRVVLVVVVITQTPASTALRRALL